LTNNPQEETKSKRYLSSTQKEVIKEFFSNLKAIHNIIPDLVDRTLGYISASKEHLSEELLLEVLSKDKELLSKIENKYHKNLTQELPPAVWSRFRWMIRDYIKENESGYIEFYHREFEDILDEFYNEKLAKNLTLILEDLFNNENALIAHAYILANRYNHKEKIEQNEYKRVVEILNKIDDVNVRDYLQILINKGDKISKLINPSPAFGYYEVALSLSKLLYIQNPDKWVKDYTKSLNNLGILYYQTSQIEKAEKLLKESLKIRKKAYEENPDRWIEDYTTSLNNLGNLYQDTNQLEKAEELFKEILDILENIDYLTLNLQQIKQNAIDFFEELNSNENGLDNLSNLMIDLIITIVLTKIEEKNSKNTKEELIDIIIKTFVSQILDKLLGEKDE